MSPKHEWMLDFEYALRRLEPTLKLTKGVMLAECNDQRADDPRDAAKLYHRAWLHAKDFPPVDLDDNGRLAEVPGEAYGISHLGDPAKSELDRAMRVVHTGGHGSFRIYYQRIKLKTSRSRHWLWSAYRADRID